VRLASISVVLASVFSAAAGAQTVAPNTVFGRYQQIYWQEQHGLPQNTVLALTATRDGYLWLGTYEGAVRFDGTRFAVFSPGNTPEIGNQQVPALIEDSAGTLWIATYGGGRTRFSNGRFTRFTTRDGLSSDYVLCLFEDSDGTLWIGTDGGGLNRWRDGRFTRGDALPGGSFKRRAHAPERLRRRRQPGNGPPRCRGRAGPAHLRHRSRGDPGRWPGVHPDGQRHQLPVRLGGALERRRSPDDLRQQFAADRFDFGCRHRHGRDADRPL
jgi:ligand-binding sensor domain-containing protein